MNSDELRDQQIKEQPQDSCECECTGDSCISADPGTFEPGPQSDPQPGGLNPVAQGVRPPTPEETAEKERVMLNKMLLHQTFNISPIISALRVPHGWLYSVSQYDVHDDKYIVTTTFVHE